MRKVPLIATALALGAGASHASAQTYAGSDTLESIATAITTACGEAPALTYVGGGSTTGENALVSGAQQIAPMSRPLRCAIADADSFSVHIADDALGIFRSPLAAGDSCTDITRDVLRQIYFGMGATGNGTGTGGTPTPDCNSGARRGLIANYSSVFAAASCGTGAPAALRHAFRRNDLSGTTDTFRDRLGISTSLTAAAPAGVPSVPFCNGNDVNPGTTTSTGGQVQQDIDPVRTACNADDDVCGPIQPNTLGFQARTLGVVLSVAVPQALQGSAAPTPLPEIFPTEACAPGRFRYRPNSRIPANGPCPNGAGSLAGLCLTPVTSTDQANCVANLQAPAGSVANFDGRTFNLTLRNAAGAVRITQPVAPATAQRVTTAYYRINSVAPGPVCTSQVDATQLIGCFARAPGAIGFAGFEAENHGPNLALTVNGVAPLLNPTTPNPGYLLYRKLFINGLNPVTAGSNWDSLLQCFRDRPNIDNVVTANGFFVASGNPGDPIPVASPAECL